jgi:Activator of Hsp90 ATPase homolog 1-like protein
MKQARRFRPRAIDRRRIDRRETQSFGGRSADQNPQTNDHIQGLAAAGVRHDHGSKKHQSLSGEKAKISQRVGGKFTAWGSHLSGINLVLKPGKKIVQAWRATGWGPDHYSIAIFDITKVKGGSKLKFTQIGIPPHRYSGHYRGWIETYWTPMKEIFAMGKISERTRTRVHINRTERIDRQRFRRKVSREA